MVRLRLIFPALLALTVAATPAAAALSGQILFVRCKSCHDVKPGAALRIGPNLAGIMGRKVGVQPGFAYSPAMKAQSFVWDDATMDRWLARPTTVVPGTRMAFAGMPNAEERKTLIAYLKKPQ